MKNSTKGAILKTIAIGIDVGVPLAATLTQFPLWVEQSAEATMSGLCLVFIGLSVIPFLKVLKEYFKSPSSWVIFGLIFMFLLLLRSILDQMLIVSFAGFVANIIGAALYGIGNNLQQKDVKERGNE